MALRPYYSLPKCHLCVTLYITLPLTLKAHFPNETSPFWVESSLNVLNFGILPTTCEAILGQGILCCGSDISLGKCMLMPSTDTLSSLSTQCIHSPAIICSGVATLHHVFTLQPNHISMDHNVLHIFSIFSPSAKTNKVFLSSSL